MTPYKMGIKECVLAFVVHLCIIQTEIKGLDATMDDLNLCISH